MKELSGDPYEGAYQAYRVLHPNATGDDWERWLAKRAKEANGNFDNFKALAYVCRKALESDRPIEPFHVQLICYSEGYFEAMERVVSSMIGTLPISQHVPQHFRRYQASFVNGDTQFE